MKVVGAEHLTHETLRAEVSRGGKFVIFQYCISILVVTFRRSSDVYYIRPGESPFVRGLPYMLISLLFGWWGIPWGPIYTLGAVGTNLGGGKDVTQEMLASIGVPGRV